MKLLFLSGHYPPNTKGGGEVSTHLLAKELTGAGHSVTVITESDEAQNGVLDSVEIIRRPLGLTKKPLFERLAAARSAIALQEVIDVQEYDIVHAHDFRSALVVAELIRAGVIDYERAIVTIRDYAAISGDTNYILANGEIPKEALSWRSAWDSYRVKEVAWPRNIGRFFQYVLNIQYRLWAFSQIPYHVFISHTQLQEIRRYLPATKQERVIYNAISAAYLKEPLRPEKPNTVLYVGRVEEYKGVRVLLQAWQIVAGQAPGVQLYIIGSGAQRGEYMAFIKQLGIEGQVTFEDHIPYDEMRERYDASSVLVAPNLWLEPFGRAVAEAMARGRVVVASDAGGPSELISNGVSGFLVKRGSVNDLAGKLLEVLTAPPLERARIGRSAREFVEKELPPQRIGQQYQELYLEVLHQAAQD